MTSNDLHHRIETATTRPWVWLTVSMLGIGVATGCASQATPEVDDARVARLPAEDREALLDQQRDMDRAEANLQAAQVAVTEAEQFRDIVENEREAAERQLEATQEAISLAEGARGRNDADVARERRDSAQTQLDAAEAKSEFADALLELRRAQVEAAEAEHEHARARMELARFERLEARDMHDDLERDDFVEAEREARERSQETRQQAAALQSRVEDNAARWSEMRDEAEANGIAPPPIEPPTAPERLDVQEEEENDRLEPVENDEPTEGNEQQDFFEQR